MSQFTFMKKFILLFFAVTAVLFGKSQTTNVEKLAAMELVQSNKVLLNINDEDLSNAIIQSTYKNKFAGTTMVYLQQAFKGIPVYNQLITLAFKDGKLISKAGEFIENIGNVVNAKSGMPTVTAENAVSEAIIAKNLKPTANPTALGKKENKIEFGKLGVSHENITAELMWFPNESGKANVHLGWQVYIIQNTSSDYWLINVDALNKNILSVHNLTVYCNWDDPTKSCNNFEHKNLDHKLLQNLNHTQSAKETPRLLDSKISSPAAVINATYRVIPYPAESPIHTGGTPALVSNPWSLSGASNNATTLNWHTIGTTNYDFTRGNNVWAQEDSNANNGTAPLQVVSSTSPDPLAFDFVPDFSVDPKQTSPVPNRQFNTVNLFYWNNIVHDLTYQYGFDEPARNFQGDNLGRGGNQNDFVLADAQDGSGTNNANFSTPADGTSGRMQMFIWTAANPDRDGDVDNGIIVHEYAHGISNRLTGSGSTCLQNAEQMGEGWSDYYSLMYTQDWATSTLTTGFTTPRGIGTYAANQAATGLGIRSQRYCTNFAVNNKVYAASIPSQVHSRGEIWCATLWDMTWGIINQVGTINPNLFNATAPGGNSIALKLVTEGLKLQPCSPGFISSRDAILQADLNLYGGAYRCTILEAFRRRGMGLGASQGSSASVTDQIPSFTNGGAALVLLQTTPTSVPEGQNITYINRITTDPCSGFTGYTITDTIPLNVTYVSGGTYNSANRVVSFPVTQAAGLTVDYSFTVTINAGTYFAPVTVFTEPVPATMPATWSPVTTVPTGGTLWTVSTLQTNSAPNAFFVNNDVVSTDKRLELANGIAVPTGVSAYSKLSFWHKFNTEDGWDGGVAEISTNGGTTWTDLGANMLTNPYNNTLGAGTGNNLSNRAAFSGLISSFIKTTVNLSPFAGQTAKLRFRFASDDNTAGTGTPTGWFVDDIDITNTATVSMRSSLFNASSVRVGFADTVTLILQGAVAPSITLTSAPATINQSICINAAITNIVYTTAGGVTGATVTGLPAGVTGSYASGVFTISGTPTVTGIFNYIVTTTGATPVASTTGTITVGANSSLVLTSAAGTTGQTVNINTAITNIVYTTGNGATGATVTGLPAGVTGAYSGGSNGTFTISGTPTVAGTFSYNVTTSGGCGSASLTGTITVATAPTITLSSAAGTNAQTVCLNTPITAISYTTAGGVTGASVTGLPAGVSGTYAGGVFTITGTPTATGTFSYTVTTSGNTPNAVATGTITVSAATTLTLTSAAATTSQTVTVNSAITNITYSTSGGVTGATVTGLPAGVTGTYSGGTNGTITISGTPTAAGTLTYTVTTSGGCGVQTASGTITSVNGPSITLTSPAGTNAQSVCVGTAINNVVYTAAGGVTGATITGLPAGVTGTYSGGTNGTFTIVGTPTVTGTFAYTLTTSGGASVATVTGTITVNGAVTLTLTSAAATTTQTVNINTAITNITYSSTGGVTAATVTGLPAGVTGVYSGGTNGTVTISGTPTVAGTFNYTVTTTGGCGTQSRTGTITVVIPPSITLTSSTGSNAQTICIGNSITSITYASAGGVTGATTAGLPAGVVGTYSGGTNGTYTITGIPTATGTFNYTVTTSGGVATATGLITVNALPAAPTVTTPVIYCQGATATALTASGTNLLWYTALTGGSGTATVIPSTSTVGSTTYYVSQTAGTCEGPRASIVVTVNATPAAPVVTATVNYCQGGTATALTATGTGLLWYTAAAGGTGTATAPTPSTATAGTTTYYVSQTTGACEGPRAAIAVTVSAGPAITVQPTNITSCTTTATFSVTATGSNLSYQWQVSTDGGLTYNNIATATSSTYTVSGLTPAQANNKYRVVVSAAGCSSATSNAVTARVGTAPSVVLTAAPTLNFNPSINGGLYITVSPVGNYTYQWKRNNTILPNLVGSTSLTKANGLLDEFGTYQVTAFDVATGCSGVSNSVTVSDIASERNRLFISPNPTRGLVKVSFYSSTTASQARIISLYDSKGAKIMTKSFNVSGNYGFVDLDLSNMSNGTYMIILRDAAGTKIASESIIKQ